MTTAAVASEAPAFSIGRVVSLTFSVLGRHLAFFFGLAFLANFLMQLCSLFFFRSAASATRGLVFNPAALLTFSVSALLAFAVLFVVQAALTYSTVMDLSDRRVVPVEALKSVARIFFPLMLIGTVYSFGMVLGFLALVVPGIMLLTAWIVVVPVRLVENTATLETFSRSAELTKGHRWPIFGLLLIVWLFAIALAVVQGPLLHALGMQLSEPVLYALLIAAIRTLSSVIGATGVACLYFVLRTEKEGVAPEQLAAVFD